MDIKTICERLTDCAAILDDDPTESQAHSTANFLRATAERIQNDADLEYKIALVTAQHNLEVSVKKMRRMDDEFHAARKTMVENA